LTQTTAEPPKARDSVAIATFAAIVNPALA